MTGCTSWEPPTVIDGELITYQPNNPPACWRCDFLRLLVASDGRVWVEQSKWLDGEKRPRTSRRLVVVAADRIAAFRDRLEKYRPPGDGMQPKMQVCEPVFTDTRTIYVAWRTLRSEVSLSIEATCDANVYGEMMIALETAPALLGIPELETSHETPSVPEISQTACLIGRILLLPLNATAKPCVDQ
jgi:hypothetical protein